MYKHIIGQSIYQATVLSIIVFLGDRFIPENLPDEKDDDGKSIIYNDDTGFIRSGRLKYPFSIKNDYHPLEIVKFFDKPGLLQHITRLTVLQDTLLSFSPLSSSFRSLVSSQ